jgi:two-component system, LytTR family, response regulator
LKALLVDDEAFARLRLRQLLADCSSVTIIGEAANGLEAIERVRELAPDVLFLDIEMPGLNGFEVVRALADSPSKPLVIFVTGYDQYALAAFEANAIAYLLKPVEHERLMEVVDRAGLICSSAAAQKQEHKKVERTLTNLRPRLRQIVARKGRDLILIRPEEIVLIKVEESVVTAQGAKEAYVVNYPFPELESNLPVELFFLARRSVLINLSKIAKITPFLKNSFLITMNDSAQSTVQVSERQARLLRQRLPGL